MKRLIKSFGHAFSGIFVFFRKEKNGQIQLFFAVLAIVLGFSFQINKLEWIAILFCIGGVLSLEMVNSVIERIMDLLHPEKSERVKRIKDMAAGAVLLFTGIALLVGVLVFGPKLIELFCSHNTCWQTLPVLL